MLAAAATAWLLHDAQRVRAYCVTTTIDPPPDLAIEVDITHSSIDRLPIFAAIGIPEVWRLAAGSLQFLHLQPDGSYQPRDPSLAFPTL